VLNSQCNEGSIDVYGSGTVAEPVVIDNSTVVLSPQVIIFFDSVACCCFLFNLSVFQYGVSVASNSWVVINKSSVYSSMNYDVKILSNSAATLTGNNIGKLPMIFAFICNLTCPNTELLNPGWDGLITNCSTLIKRADRGVFTQKYSFIRLICFD